MLRFNGAWKAAAFAVTMLASPGAAQVDPLAPLAQPATMPTGFDAYKLQLMARARQAGVREATIQAYIPALNLSQRAIQLDRSQPGGPPNSGYIPPFSPYERAHVTPDLIRRGQARYASMYGNLARIQARYGVDSGVLLAIYGHETSFGKVTGGFDLLDALASLAYEGRRRAMFETEFVAALKLIDIGVPRWRLKGSYAGATGYPQFMPSVVLQLRADGDGDGYADIWGSESDGLASIANYLRNAGWKPGMPWGVSARVPSTLNRAAIRSTLTPSRCQRVYSRHSRWLTVAQWRSLGVVPTRGGLTEMDVATLIEPDGQNGSGYLLTNNYRAILDYNCSNFYALSVGLLANAITGR